MDVSREEIYAKLGVEGIYGNNVVRAGGNRVKMLCPFHAEKTPSFFINSETLKYKCWGCGRHGDPIQFYMEQGMTFLEAVEHLAQKAGVAFEKWAGDGLHSRLYRVNEAAMKYFQEQLANNRDPRDYLEGRGYTEEIIRKWRIGYSDGKLAQHLLKMGFTEEDIVTAGLAKKNGRLRDVFWGRIMFPILVNGKCKGFGGRVIGDEEPKFINTATTPVFQKGETIYGLNPYAIKTMGYAIVVEGYSDTHWCHQYGFKNAGAPLGTEFTEKQAEILRKYTNRVVLIFDSDGSGQFAAERKVKMLFDMKMEGAVVELPKGEDPDTFLRKNGDLGSAIDLAVPLSVFLARFKGTRRMMFQNLVGRSPFSVAEFLAYGGTAEERKLFSELSMRHFISPFLENSPVAFRKNDVVVRKHWNYLVLIDKGVPLFHRKIVEDYKKEATQMGDHMLGLRRKAEKFNKKEFTKSNQAQ